MSKYNSIPEIINNIPSYLKIDFNDMDIAISNEMYDKYYRVIEEFENDISETSEPSLTNMRDSVSFVLSPFKKSVSVKMYALYWHIYNMFLYRLVYLMNVQSGYKYDALLEKIQSEFEKVYEFVGVDFNYSDIISF